MECREWRIYSRKCSNHCGRAVYSDNNWAANYYICDHLGSVRAVTDAEGEVLENL